MDPISIILLAFVTGAAAAAKGAGPQAVKDSYAGLKELILRKFGSKGDVQNAVEQTEKRPDSEARQAVLKEELQAAGADKDEALLKQAQALLDLLKQLGLSSGSSYSATMTGSGAIAQGSGSIAAGAGGIAVGGNVGGDITLGTHIAGDLIQGDKVMRDKISRQINTGGGAYVSSNVNVIGGKFVGRDDLSRSSRSSADDARSRLTPDGQMVAGLLEEYFDEDELRDISYQIKWDWDKLSGDNRHAKVDALVDYCERRAIVPQLKAVMRLARPQLRRQLK